MGQPCQPEGRGTEVGARLGVSFSPFFPFSSLLEFLTSAQVTVLTSGVSSVALDQLSLCTRPFVLSIYSENCTK